MMKFKKAFAVAVVLLMAVLCLPQVAHAVGELTAEAEPVTQEPMMAGEGAPSGKYYELTTTLESGSKYLIVSANSGAAYALGHDGTTVAADDVAVIADDGITYINASDVDATSVWSVTKSSSKYTFNNDSNYIQAKSSGTGNSKTYSLAISSSSTSWSQSSDKGSLYYSSSSSSSSKYYLGYDSEWKVGSKGTKYSIYFFKEVEVFSVTVTSNNNEWGTASATPTTGSTGTTVNLTATPAEGYELKEWNVISGGVTVADNSFTLGTQNVEIQAVFQQACNHSWTFGGFIWDETVTPMTAEASYTCSNCSETKTVNATVTSEDIAATCEEPGKVKYTASVTAAASLDGAAHDSGDDPKIVTPMNEAQSAWLPVSELTAGETQYIITLTSGGKEYALYPDPSNVKTTDLSNTKLGELGSQYKWTCEDDGGLILGATSTGTNPQTKYMCWKSNATEYVSHSNSKWAGWSYADGKLSYSGQDAYNKVDQSNTYYVSGVSSSRPTVSTNESEAATVTLYTYQTKEAGPVTPATGHDWDYSTISWAWVGNETYGYTAATATVACKNNSAHTKSFEATITGPVNGVMTATITGTDGIAYTDTKTYASAVSVNSVAVSPTSATLKIGETTTLTATIDPENATNKNVTWSSSSEDVATVDESGLVTAVGVGTATITATTEDGSKTATCAVEVKPIEVTGVTVAETASVVAGETVELVATVAPENATNKSVSWESSDTAVATVSNGVVTGVSAGTANITVTTADGGKTATCTVTVTAAPKYVQTTQLVAGAKYLIVSAESGEAVALKTPGTATTISADQNFAVNIQDGSIETNNKDIIWTAEAATGGVKLTDGTVYLYAGSSSLKTNASTSSSISTFTYSGDQLKSTNSRTVYYDGSQFKSTSSTSNTDKLYLFVEAKNVNVTVGQAEGGTATADKTTGITGETVTLTATPDTANGYVLKGWEVLSGGVTIAEDGTFTLGTEDVTIKPVFHSHNWTFTGFTWDEDADSVTAVANYACAGCNETPQVNAHIDTKEIAATCQADGQVQYTASVSATESLDGYEHTSDVKTVTPMTKVAKWEPVTALVDGTTYVITLTVDGTEYAIGLDSSNSVTTTAITADTPLASLGDAYKWAAIKSSDSSDLLVLKSGNYQLITESSGDARTIGATNSSTNYNKWKYDNTAQKLMYQTRNNGGDYYFTGISEVTPLVAKEGTNVPTKLYTYSETSTPAYPKAAHVDKDHNGVCDVCQTTLNRSAVALYTSINGTKASVNGATLMGGGVYYDPAIVEGGSLKVTVTAPVVKDFTFNGWKDKDGNVKSTSLSYTFDVDGINDCTLYADYTANENTTFKLTVTSDAYTVVASGSTDNGNGTYTVPVGAQVTVTYTGSDNFLYWANATGKIVTSDKAYTFAMVGDKSIESVIGANESKLVFLNSPYGVEEDQVLSAQTVSNASTDIDYPAPPSKMGYTFKGWMLDETTSASITNIQSAIDAGTKIIKMYPKYEQGSETYTVTALYVDKSDAILAEATTTASELVGTGTVLEAKTIDGYNFLYWTDADGNVLGYTSELFLRPTTNMTVKAVYGTSAVSSEPVITMTDKFAKKITTTDDNGTETTYYKVSFTATRSVPEDYSVVETGVLYTYNGAVTAAGLTDDDAIIEFLKAKQDTNNVKKVADPSTERVSTLTVNISTSYEDRTFYAIGFMTIVDGNGNAYTIYSPNLVKGSYNSLTGNGASTN